jgi:hypothetical protein
LGIKRKQKRTNAFYIFINILSFSITAGLIILNIFAIRWNNNKDINKMLFVAIAIVTGLVGATISITTLFNFKTNSQKFQNKINLIEIEKKKFESRKEECSKKNPQEIFINKIIDIKNKKI